MFSNATLHWVQDADPAADAVAQALKPGGRFVAEFGGRGNIQFLLAAVQAACKQVLGTAVEPPWYFPSIGEYAGLLERKGLEVQTAVLIDRPTPLDSTDALRMWIRMFWGKLLSRIPSERQNEFLDRVEAAARPMLFRDGGWVADYRRLRLMAVKPA